MTKREVIKKVYNQNYQDGQLNLVPSSDKFPLVFDQALATLAQIEESKRLTVEEIERIVKITLPVGKEWARDVAQAIYEAQRAMNKR